ASGLFLARVHVARWPALLGTPYGATLLAKLAFMTAALALAARLRWRALPRARETAEPVSMRPWLLAEAAFGGLAVFAAALLAETVPAAHDTIAWWLPFRFSIRATWGLPWVAERVGFGVVLVVCAVALAAARWRRGERGGAIVGFAAFTSVAGAFALPAISVPAFPGTYWTPDVPYHAISVANGRRLYREHCVRCHGEAGRGDGPLAREQPKPPANLTEPHTADHTAGDMFWWLTHGIEDSGMPPFADVLSPDERWDLVNYLRAFASGYQGRILGSRVSPEKPWLGAIDFNYRLEDDGRGLLRDFRGRAVVLLVLFTPGTSDARLARLQALLPEIRRAGGEVLVVPTAPSAPRSYAPLPIVAAGAEDVVESFLLLRRTFADPGNDADDDRPPHLELLIDRSGYVRARWRPDLDTDGWDDDERLVGEIAILAREPQILLPPDDHVH
ncbi:MAG: c-type cytochrome, partial [Candidatus Binatia bacterium]